MLITQRTLLETSTSYIHLTDIIIDNQGHYEKVTAEIMDLGTNQVILGYMWLKKHNPDIDWTNGEVKMTHCPHSCYLLHESQYSFRYLKRKKSSRPNLFTRFEQYWKYSKR